ncbi:FtsW/RodA/SpoVE family cell cycle protein [Kineococcus rubinsiae]|uniref:FtsW/RodA/SpoVE family cell cycle protein n=1 Tax=Kineococcus rubinsiae TaxID=2609562 RepID=UPI00142FE85E|nr:FtsW/RodA/SpoVE family cell cycle protein [Kineococcus rubinsiae]NIZ90750.1 FtsW/RodA/SpoVE family cell cycle protein [Kineococcus rubinsiae]
MATVTPVYPATRRNTELALLVMAVVVATGAWAVVGLTEDGRLPPGLALYGGGLAGLAVLLHLVLRWKAAYADPVLLPVATLLNGLGLVVIHRLDLSSSRTDQAPRQLLWTAIGVVAAGAVLWLLRDHRVLRRYTFTAMVAGLVLLLLPLLPGIGRTINGARIWIGIGPLSFQPGELAKIVLAVFFAGYLVVHRDALSLTGPKLLFLRLPRARDLGPILVAWLASVGVLVLQRDLGTSLLFFGLFVAVLYVATERVSWIVLGLLLFVAGAVLAATTFSHVQERVAIWLHPFAPDNADQSYQLVQGLYGMANGGLLGTGLDRGRPDIVPFANSDFIYSSIGEELGLVGLFAVLLLYGVLVERGLRTAIAVRDGFGKLLAAGLAFSVTLQVFVVVGGVTRIIPLTGLTMPFLAAGGSSLVSNWIVVGLLLRISDLARRPAPEVRNGPGDTGVTQAVRIP